MAHFAEIDENNIVVRVLVVPDDQENRGQEYLANDLGLNGRWIQTSYNSYGGVHYDPNTDQPSGKPALRKNFAGVGSKYDEILDAFIPPKPDLFSSWVINPETALWEPPIPKPNDPDNHYFWNEDTQQWIKDIIVDA